MYNENILRAHYFVSGLASTALDVEQKLNMNSK